MRRMVPVLVAGLLAVAGVVAPASRTQTAAAATADPKIVLIVGATHGATSAYRDEMDTVYAVARQHSSNVVKVYSPNATWAAVKAAIQGASIVVYMGHGNGFPGPYFSTLWPDRQDGFGLNAVAGQGDGNTTYYGESYIASSVTLAPSAVVILAHLCYASGNSEPGLTPPTLAVAQARIDNFAAGFLRTGARAVIADAHSDTSWYVDQLFTTHQTLDQLFRTKPWGAGNTFTFASSRTPGFTAYADPDVAAPPGGFYRSMVARPTLRTDDVTGIRVTGAVGDALSLSVPGAAEVTGDGGVGLYPDPTLAADPATGAPPVLLPGGTRLRILASASTPSGLAYQAVTLDGAQAGWVGPAGLSPRDGTPPVIGNLAVSPAAINPTLGRGAMISATASKEVDWSVSILDAASSSVASFAASGPTLSSAWGGRDGGGQPVPDGSYTVVATARDAWGNPPATARATVTVDATPPVLGLSGVPHVPIVLSPNGDGLDERARVAFALSEPAAVEATIRDAAGATVRTITLAGAAGPGAITWDGQGAGGLPVPDGPYSLDLTARDAAGGAAPTLTAPIVVATARSGLAAAPAWFAPAGRGTDPRVSNLSFVLARPASVTWQVTTAAGVPVRTWYADASLGPGSYVESWDGRTDTGALAPSGRYLSRVTVADGITTTAEQTWVFSGGIRIVASDPTPAAGQAVTITVVFIEALGSNPSVWVAQPGRAGVRYPATRVGTSTYRVRIRLAAGPAGPVTVRVSGVDRFGRAAGASVAYRLH